MLVIAISYYCAIAFMIFLIWFQAFLTDTTTPNYDLLSWIVLIVGASLWVVVLPLTNLEVISKHYSIDHH